MERERESKVNKPKMVNRIIKRHIKELTKGVRLENRSGPTQDFSIRLPTAAFQLSMNH
jgi:hypothetical protein